MNFGIHALRNYPSERRPFNCQTVVSAHKLSSVIRIPPKKLKLLSPASANGKKNKRIGKSRSFFKVKQKKISKDKLECCKPFIFVKETLIVNKRGNVVKKSAELCFTDKYLDR